MDSATTLRRCLRRLARGSGPWPVQPVAEATRDGSTLLVVLAVPLPRPQLATLPTPREDAGPHGRPAEVPRDLLRWLQGRTGANYSDIIDGMTQRGHSPAQAAETLAKLVQMGLVDHPRRGAPYRSLLTPDMESNRVES